VEHDRDRVPACTFGKEKLAELAGIVSIAVDAAVRDRAGTLSRP
jgi:hypothetical protein